MTDKNTLAFAENSKMNAPAFEEAQISERIEP